MSLHHVQSEFLEMIFSDEEHAGTAHPAANRLIYRNTITTTLVKALFDIYPMIVQLVGSDFFTLAANHYISRYPSRSSNLHDYGQYVSDFLSEYDKTHHLVYLAEVAKFEWACHTLRFAAHPIEFDFNLLKKEPPDDYGELHFMLHPACHLISFHYPILRIHDLCQHKTNDAIDLDEGGVNLLLIRPELEIMLIPLMQSDFAFLSALHEAKTLSESLEEAMRIDPAFNLDEKLPAWIKDKTIVDFY